MKKLAARILLVAVIAALVAAFFYFDLGGYLTLQYVKEQQAAFVEYYENRPIQTIAVFMAIYIVTTAASLPGAAVLTLASGALFGVLAGTIIVSFSSTIGATLAFLIARFALRDTVQNKFEDRLEAINKGVEKDGALYLFVLRLVPAFPFFVINLAMALTPIRTITFFWVSQLGMLPGTVVYVNAGTQLGQIESPSGILSADLILSFVLLGIFPFVARKIVDVVKPAWTLRKYERPKSFDYNLVVIGAGSAGLVSAFIASTVRAKVALVEKNRMGGDCLNTGCVPSKALIRSARVLTNAKRAREFGLGKAEVSFRFADVMQRVHRVIQTVAPHDSVERYTELGVDVYCQAEARLASPYAVEIRTNEGVKTLTTKAVVLATGAEPFVPPIEGLKEAGYLTSDTLWQLEELPRRLVVLGAGPIGCELAQAFARFGSDVTQVEKGDRLLSREDEDVGELMKRRFEAEGIRVLTSHEAKRARVDNGQKILVCEGPDGSEVPVEADAILVAVGRKPRTEGFGLEELGVRIAEKGTIETDDFLRTNFPNIYVCGDAAGPYQFTHTAGHQAWYAAVNALFSPLKTFEADYNAVPWCTFTDPEVAHVGLNEAQARQKGTEYEVTTYGIDDLDRAIAEEEAIGFVKVLTRPGKDRILGATIVGESAGEIIGEYVLAMKHGIGLKKILGTIHIYPTLSEANRHAAGNWAKEHKPEAALRILERFHQWRRA